MSDEIADAAALLTAVAASGPGDTLRLAAGRFYLDRPLSLSWPLTLRGPQRRWPVLYFTTAEAMLSVVAAGCSLRHLVLTATGHRTAPLLRLEAADDAMIADVVLWRTQGSGLHAERCRNLRITGLMAAELGLEAASFAHCTHVSLAATCRGIGRRVRAAGIKLDDSSDFALTVDADDISASAVSIQSRTGTPMSGCLSLQARGCRRALTVIGASEHPAEGLSGTIRAEDFTEFGVLLSNVRGLSLCIASGPRGVRNVLRCDGVFGARSCSFVIESDSLMGELVEQRGGSRDNLVVERARRVADASAPDALPPQAAWVAEADEDRSFDLYEVEGMCSVCGWQGVFRRTHLADRESLGCGRCAAVLRYRGQADALLQALGGQHATLADLAASGLLAGLAIFEPGVSGPLRRHLSQAGYYCRSFYEPGLASGTVRDGIACQDLMATSFPDATFDLVVTSDIFEHVRRPWRGFAEIRRILKPGGMHVFTVPFQIPPLPFTRARVDTSGDADVHLLPPRYHGSGTGGLSLVYTDFGKDIRQLLEAQGMRTEVIRHSGRTPQHIVAVTLISHLL